MKNLVLKIMAAYAALLVKAVSLYNRILPSSDLAARLTRAERGAYLGLTSTASVHSLLAGRRLVCLDVGARGGPSELLRKHGDDIDLILVEPEPAEGAKLTASGYTVIDQALGGEQRDDVVINICRSPGASSLLRPWPPVADFYAGESNRLDIVEEVHVPMTTIALALEGKRQNLDYLKLDTQGTELDILRGLGRFKPLAIITEISVLPLYQDSCLLWDVGAYLREQGYLMSDLMLGYVAPSPRHRFRPCTPRSYGALPVTGDAWFIPDWTSPRGMEMIRQRDREYAATMSMLGLENILNFVLHRVETPNRAEIMRTMGW